MLCPRCGKEATAHTGSYFTADQVCFACAELERQHPDYERARAVEAEHVRRGDTNFPGVGLPAGYAAWAAAAIAPSVPGCTGYLDDHHGGQLVHDGDTCPVHENPTIIRLSGADCIGVELGSSAIEVRQYHLEHQEASEGEDEHGVYEVVQAASGTARVTAGPSPGRAAEHRGVRAWATIEDNPEHANYVVVRCYLEPPPRGLDRLVYSHQAVRVPEGHRV